MIKTNLSQIGKTIKRLAALAAVAALVGVVSLPAQAACTLNADPSLNLTGTWAFQVNGVLTSDVLEKIFVKVNEEFAFGLGLSKIPGGGTIAGIFTATGVPARRGDPGGGLTVLASANLSNAYNSTGGVIGASPFQGTFQINGGCDFGTLQFASGNPNLGSPYDFYFTNLAKTEMFLIGMQWEYVFSGIAKKVI